jgi:hypothetical protein
LASDLRINVLSQKYNFITSCIIRGSNADWIFPNADELKLLFMVAEEALPVPDG